MDFLKTVCLKVIPLLSCHLSTLSPVAGLNHATGSDLLLVGRHSGKWSTHKKLLETCFSWVCEGCNSVMVIREQ